MSNGKFCVQQNDNFELRIGEKRYRLPSDKAPDVMNRLWVLVGFYLEWLEHEGRIATPFAELCDDQEDCEKCRVHLSVQDIINSLEEVEDEQGGKSCDNSPSN